MLEINNPEMTVKELAQKIISEVESNKEASLFYKKTLSDTNNILINRIDTIKSILENAKMNSEVPAKFPDKLNRFILKNQNIQKIILRIYSFLFKKQRIVNLSLIEGLNQSLELNRQLISQVSEINKYIKTTEERLIVAEENIKAIAEQLNSKKI